MLKPSPWRCSWDGVAVNHALLPLAFGMAILTATTTPAAAQSVVIQQGGATFGVNQYPINAPYIYQPPAPAAAPFVYGSPIPTPVPVDPATGLLPTNTYNNYPVPVRRRVEDSTLINPVLVNPRIRNSTLINPVIVDDPVDHNPVRYP